MPDSGASDAGWLDAGTGDGGSLPDSGVPQDGGFVAAAFFGLDTLGNSFGAMPYPRVYGDGGNVAPGLLRLWDNNTAWPSTWRRSGGTISLTPGQVLVGGTASFDSSHVLATLAFDAGEALIAAVDAGVALLNLPWNGPAVSGQTYRAYSWSYLDQLVDAAGAHGAQVLYVWWLVPGVYSVNNTDTLCHNGAGECYPPADLNDAGPCSGSLAGTSGTDCEARTYTTDLLRHLRHRGTPPAFLELGNETDICSNNFGDAGSLCPAQSHVSKLKGAPEWCGSIADFYALTADVAHVVRTESPTTLLVGPGVTVMGPSCSGTDTGPQWLAQWLSLGGGALVNAIGFHGYLGTDPEQLDSCVANYQAFLAAQGVGNKPICDTEYSWSGAVQAAPNGGAIKIAARASGQVTVTLDLSAKPAQLQLVPDASVAIRGVPGGTFDGTFTVMSTNDTDAGDSGYTFTYSQAGPDASVAGSGPTGFGAAVLPSMLPFERDFVARSLLVQYSRGLQMAVWYGGTNDDIGTLCDAWTDAGCTSQRPSGVAWGEVARWLSDATPMRPCSDAGTVWVCPYTLPGARAAQAVWDTDGGSLYPAPNGAAMYRDLSGASGALDGGGFVQIGPSPIFLE